MCCLCSCFIHITNSFTNLETLLSVPLAFLLHAELSVLQIKFRFSMAEEGEGRDYSIHGSSNHFQLPWWEQRCFLSQFYSVLEHPQLIDDHQNDLPTTMSPSELQQ
jgi:hypothetical protein